MLVVRAPIRISFAGGGTDLEAYYARYGGLVVSTTINKYFYMMVSPSSSDSLQIISSDYQTFHLAPSQSTLFPNDLALPRAIFQHFGLERGLGVFLASEVPPGTGLGSSSAAAVAVIKGLSTLLEIPMSKREVAELAAEIEIRRLGMPIGRQDQYAASYGGLNCIRFTADGCEAEKLRIDPNVLARLHNRLLLFFTGSTRESSSILTEQRRASSSDEQVIANLHAIKALALETKEALEAGDLDAFGQLLDRGWQRKKNLATNITNTFIDACYALSKRSGAIGGKITGAGGGGFLMLYCPEEHQTRVAAALQEKGLRQMEFEFEFQGAQVLLNTMAGRPPDGRSA